MSLVRSVSRMFQRPETRRKKARLRSGSNHLLQALRVEALEDRCLLDGSWTTLAPMLAPRGSAAAAALDGQLYVISGHTAGSTTRAVEAYDPTTDTWMPKTSIPTQRGYAGAAAIAGKLYVVGGCIDNDCRIGTTNLLEVYDPATDTWVSKTPMPTARHSMAVGAIDGKLYVAGGVGADPADPVYNTLEVYDPTTDTWTSEAPMNTARAGMGGTVIDGQFYVVGGTDSTRTVVAALEVYDPTTDTWTTKRPMSMARTSLGAGEVNGILYAVSGQFADGNTDIVEAYNPATDCWTTDAPIPTARYSAQPVGINGVLYVAGSGANNTAIPNFEAFAPTTLAATGTTLSATTGQRFAAVVASFTDSGPKPGAPTDYSAVIDWGDGSSMSTGGVSDDGGGNYDVAASHTYAAAGEYQATVTTTDNRDPSRIASAYTTIDVADPGAPRAGDSQERGIRLMEVAGALQAERTSPICWASPVAGTSAETAAASKDTLTYPPLPSSAVEAGWAQEWPLQAQESAESVTAGGQVAVWPNPWASEPLDRLRILTL